MESLCEEARISISAISYVRRLFLVEVWSLHWCIISWHFIRYVLLSINNKDGPKVYHSQFMIRINVKGFCTCRPYSYSMIWLWIQWSSESLVMSSQWEKETHLHLEIICNIICMKVVRFLNMQTFHCQVFCLGFWFSYNVALIRITVM